MILESRSSEVLLYIIKNKQIALTSLYEKFALTDRQFGYMSDKINDFLANYQLGEIHLQEERVEIISDEYEQLYGLASLILEYIPSELERQHLIILMVIALEEDISLMTLSLLLSVSKNTVLKDIKAANEFLKQTNLELKYSRKTGYFMAGSEWEIRKKLFQTLNYLLGEITTVKVINHYINIAKQELEHATNKIHEAENALKGSYIENQAQNFLYFYMIVSRRIIQGYTIDHVFMIELKDLSDTKEHQIVTTIIDAERKLPDTERLYLVLQFLSIGKRYQEDDTNSIAYLAQSLEDFVTLFEVNALIVLPEKKALLEKLIRHFKPAYYRIKYDLNILYAPLDNLLENFQSLHKCVQKSVEPLEQMLEKKVPENEITYLTIFLGSHLIEQKMDTTIRKRAIVICTSGVSISKMLRIRLAHVFPEFTFLPALSERDFYKGNIDFDIVFSVIPLRVNHDFYYIDTSPSDEELQLLRMRVLQELFDIDMKQSYYNYAIKVIEQHVTKAQLQKIKADLVGTDVTPRKENLEYKDVARLLTKKRIQIVNSMPSWLVALDQVAVPLLRDKIINQTYVEAVKKTYPTLQPNIYLQSEIAVPHEAADKGVHDVGMSMLLVKEGVATPMGLVYCIVMIASNDTVKHIGPMLTLSKLAENKTLMQHLRCKTTANEVYNAIVNYN